MEVDPKKLKKIFVDTSAFIALADQSEDHHASLIGLVSSLPHSIKMVTTNFVLDETITRLRALLGVDVAYDFAQKLMKLPQYHLVTIESKIFLAALEMMKKYKDKTFSFTDCTSFVVMHSLKLQYAMSLDSDFQKAGFILIS